jgi:hypothetical protein
MSPKEGQMKQTSFFALIRAQRILGLTLVALTLVWFEGVHAQPKSGDWKVVADFGQFILTVSAGGSSINKIAYTWANWKCGGVTLVSGGITSMSTWSITSNQFTIMSNLGTNQTMTIAGTFTPTGDQVSGTYSANMYGTICSGNWGPVGPLVSVDDRSRIPGQYALSQNYPNPFNPSTTIQYALPSRSQVTLTIYNTLGQIVRELVNGEMEAGYHSVEFDGSNLASGVYLYRMQAGSFVQTRKLILLR